MKRPIERLTAELKTASSALGATTTSAAVGGAGESPRKLANGNGLVPPSPSLASDSPSVLRSALQLQTEEAERVFFFLRYLGSTPTANAERPRADLKGM